MTLLLAAGAWLLWRNTDRDGSPGRPQQTVAPAVRPHLQSGMVTVKSASTAPGLFAAGKISTNTVAKVDPFAHRLSNTAKTIGELAGNPRAILLANAFIDTRAKLNLSIPKNLQSQGDPGAYIVQANGPIDNAFRALLAAAGAQIVSYIPNDAYLVRMSASGASEMSGDPMTEAVIPYEPYYKISSAHVNVQQKISAWSPMETNQVAKPTLLDLAVNQKPLPAGTDLKLGLFSDNAAATIQQVQKLGGKILAQDRSPFGPVVIVQPPENWTGLAQLAGVQIVEPASRRASGNDLARVTLGISTDTVTATNYLGLSGSNVLVEVNDTGIDANHPDFSVTGSAKSPGTVPPSRVFGDTNFFSLVDTNGHGTHVAGIIAGNGSKSYFVTNAPQGSVTNADFRGKAPAADLYSVGFLDANGNSLDVPDSYLQETPARTNALISNNSWDYTGDSAYDLAAASYDAAVRDALPGTTGSQPVLFVFAAGNSGGGDDSGDGGDSDTILSPATAKNVITVGALEQLRNITNIVTDFNGNSNAVWQPQTDSSIQVAGYSSCGNVGIGTEGAYGRFKPDVVAPGSFVVSTRSSEWNQIAYYNPTNYYFDEFSDVLESNSFNGYLLSLSFFPPNTTFNSNVVGVSIEIVTNALSPTNFPDLQIYVSQNGPPDPTNSSTYDFVTFTNGVSIPPDGGGSYLSQIQNGNLYYTIVNTNNETVNYDVITEITTTNENGNYFTVLSNLNNTLGPYYRYESGTSMATPAVSGVLALMQDYFTNSLHLTPSPALLKAMLINGSRAVGSYKFAVTNGVNVEGWGLPNLPDSLPPGVTNKISAGCSSFFLDQSPTNALATGDSHTFNVAVASTAQTLPLRVTLAWTDPPGNPAAAIKLVNNLDLVVSNETTHAVYIGNDISPGSTFNLAWNTNNAPNLDSINNVENVFLSSASGTNYSVTVIGRDVNVNAVTAQTNSVAGVYAPNVVQDFALVISSGNGQVINALMVTPAPFGVNGVVSNPTADQDITSIGTTNSPLLDQFVGASSPLLGTNTIQYGSSNVLITIGQTNQWHFYVVANTGASNAVKNAAFITFLPDTLSIPRMGVFADSDANSTRPEADIDLFVSTDPALTNLDPVVISNCVNGVQQVGASSGGVFNGSSLSRGGTEFVADTNSTPGQVYYIGVQSEDQNASEYGFLPVFTATPFSQLNGNGTETVNGVPLPVNIPDGNSAHPGIGYVFALALYPMDVNSVTVTNVIAHQHLGDLIGTLGHNDISDVLNNHDAPDNPPSDDLITNAFFYDDSPAPAAGSQPSDGPGSLLNFTGTQATGPWILSELDDGQSQTGNVAGLTLLISPHQNLQNGFDVAIAPDSWAYGYIDVPAGYTNLNVSATNVSVEFGLSIATPPLELFVDQGSLPTAADTNEVFLTNCLSGIFPTGIDPGNSISTGPPLTPGRYFVGIFNPSAFAQEAYVIATLGFSASAIATVDYDSSGPVPILDDAVTTDSIVVTNTDIIQDFNVGLRVDHPRISDLVFHLISPDGTRYLLMENRGGTSTNGCGATIITTNTVNTSSSGGPAASTNFINVGETSGTIAINYDMFTIPDEMTVYYGTNPPANVLTNFFTSGIGQTTVSFGPGASTYLTIVMNQGGNMNSSTAWTYTVGGVQTNYLYLAFTEDTNLTTTPIKFAPLPFVPSTVYGPVWADNFDTYPTNIYVQGVNGNIGDWQVLVNQVEITTNPPAFSLMNLLSLDNGAVLTNLPTVAGQRYSLSYELGSSASDTGMPATNANWQFENTTFTASQDNQPLVLNASGDASLPEAATNTLVFTFGTNTLVDSFALSTVPGNLYYQPEQDMSAINGQSAAGTWTLEIQDDRAGAGLTNSLVSWQLAFTFANTNFTPIPSVLTAGQPQTNIVAANSITWYQINVPANADYATNILLFATAPVNLLFNQTAPSTNGSMVLLSNSTGNTSVLSAYSGSPLLSPGNTYYLGVQNNNGFAVTSAVEVNFHLTFLATLNDGVPQTNSVAADSINWYQIDVPANADYATNLLLSATAPVNLWFSANYPPTTDSELLTSQTSGSAVLATNSIPPLVPGGTYYLGVQNNNGSAVTNAIEVIFHLNFPPSPPGEPTLPSIDTNNIIIITNAPYNAVGDGVTDDTIAIQEAIDAAGAGGATNGASGGTVEVPCGVYLSGPITLTNNVNLQIDGCAILRMLPFGTYPGTTSGSPFTAPNFISGKNLHDIEISGSGAIDGQGSPWWPYAGNASDTRPHMINTANCDRQLIEDVTLSNSPMFHIYIAGSLSGNSTIRGVTVLAPPSTDPVDPSHNTDACDVSGTNILVENCNISVGDDDFATSGGTSDILLTNNTYGNGHGVSIGSGTSPGVSNMTVINCTFNGTQNGIRIKSDNDRGGIVQNISYLNLGMTNVNIPIQIYSYYKEVGTPVGITPQTAASEPVAPVTSATPIYRNITFSNITATSVSGYPVGIIWSRTEMPATNIVFDKINLTGDQDFCLYNVSGAQFIDSKITVSANATAFTLFNAQVIVTNSAPTNTLFTFDGLAADGYGNGFAFYNALASLEDTNALALDSYVTLGAATFTVSNSLALSPANTLNFVLGTNSATIAVVGDLVLGGTGNIIAGGGFTNGTYTLMTYTGGLSGSLPALGATPAGYAFVFDTNTAGQVKLVALLATILTNGVPQTNIVASNSIAWQQVNVPLNADFATNLLLFASLPVNVWFSTNVPPTTDVELLTNSTGGTSVLSAYGGSPLLVPGTTYYLGVQNTNSVAVTNALEVDFHLLSTTSSPSIFISSIVYTNISTTNGFLLTWFAPSNDLFQVEWTPSLTPASWTLFTNIVGYNTGAFTSPTNTQFNFFDDGTQTGGFGPMRFYRLILLQATNTLTLPFQANRVATVSAPFAVTNTATDSDTSLVLNYDLTSSPFTSAAIDNNGIITWTPDPTNADNEFKFTTVVTDNGLPFVSATNSFTVFVVQSPSSFPSITNVIATSTNTTLQWWAPTNDLFQVEWTPSLAPPSWTLFPEILTSTSGLFMFTDTNAPLAMKFYRLDWLPLP